MKKILYIMFTVSLLAASCTKEVLVSRDHDIDAEVLDMQTKMEMTTLYCNLNEADNLDLQKLGEYLTEKSADVAMFVAPVSVNGVDFKAWLDAYAAENGALSVLEARNNNGVLTMAALVNSELSTETFRVVQGAVLNNAVLHFKANGIHFVVTELLPAKNAIPSDWEDQVAAMESSKKSVPLVYDPDNLETRKSELQSILKQTVDNASNAKEKHWVLAINMNAESELDITKYNREFLRADYYDDVTEDFLAKETLYFSVSETLDANDPYFGANKLMLYYNLVDCNSVHHSVYTPSSVGGVDGLRVNFLYATDECWNLFRTFDFDTVQSAELGVTHYPIIVTLKSEE